MSIATLAPAKPKTLGTKKMAKHLTKMVVSQAATYASQQNARYNHTGSIYVTLNQRFNQTLANLPAMKATGIRAQISAACKEFQKR